MNVERSDDYREGVFWLIAGAAFAAMGLGQFDDWHGIQPWYFYALGAGLFIVTIIIAPRTKWTHSQQRRMWLPLIIAVVVSAILAIVSDEVRFVSIFPLVLGLLAIGTGLWLMLRPKRTAGGSDR